MLFAQLTPVIDGGLQAENVRQKAPGQMVTKVTELVGRQS
jgi:hypothetical protein